MAPRKKHQSRSVEVHVMAPRQTVWAEIEGWFGSLIESATDLSVEPPWRRCYSVDTAASALDFYQATFLIRDDGPECHVAWAMVFDPEPTPAGFDVVAEECARMQAHLDDLSAKFTGG